MNLFAAPWRGGWPAHSLRSAAAACLSYFVARLIGMPEAYWAALTTIVVMQSTLGAAWDVSIQRFAGTLLGAGLGLALASAVSPGLLVYGAAIFALGMLCPLLRLDESAYRFAGLTLTLVLMLPRTMTPLMIALHRVIEVTIGIAVALAVSAVWPHREPGSVDPPR